MPKSKSEIIEETATAMRRAIEYYDSGKPIDADEWVAIAYGHRTSLTLDEELEFGSLYPDLYELTSYKSKHYPDMRERVDRAREEIKTITGIRPGAILARG